MHIYGKNPIKDLFDKNPKMIKKIYIEKKRHQFFYEELKKSNIQVEPFESLNIKRLFYKNENLQGIIAVIESPKIYTLKDLILKHKDDNKSVFIILDRITDPQNFGAILRNAAAFGVNGVIFPSRESSPLSSIAMKASAGNWMNVDLCETSSLNQVVEYLKKNGYWIVSTSLDADQSVDTLKDFNQPMAIILGSEGSGVKKSLQEKSEIKIKIDMSDKVESLNVASASAIILHYLKK